MSRSGYGDYDCDSNTHYLWGAIVRRAARGRRGQAFFRALIAALDAMPVKELIAHQIVCDEGVCALGSMIRERPEAREIDPEDYNHHDELADLVDVAPALVAEVEYQNDEGAPWSPGGRGDETPAERWTRMRGWAEMQILREVSADG